MAKKKADLREALRDTAGSTRGITHRPAAASQEPSGRYQPPPSRVGKVQITLHVPGDVRTQLKTMAAQSGRTMHDLAGEALNDFFAKYGKPEIAPTAKAS